MGGVKMRPLFTLANSFRIGELDRTPNWVLLKKHKYREIRPPKHSSL